MMIASHWTYSGGQRVCLHYAVGTDDIALIQEFPQIDKCSLPLVPMAVLGTLFDCQRAQYKKRQVSISPYAGLNFLEYLEKLGFIELSKSNN